MYWLPDIWYNIQFAFQNSALPNLLLVPLSLVLLDPMLSNVSLEPCYAVFFFYICQILKLLQNFNVNEDYEGFILRLQVGAHAHKYIVLK